MSSVSGIAPTVGRRDSGSRRVPDAVAWFAATADAAAPPGCGGLLTSGVPALGDGKGVIGAG